MGHFFPIRRKERGAWLTFALAAQFFHAVFSGMVSHPLGSVIEFWGFLNVLEAFFINSVFIECLQIKLRSELVIVFY